MPTKREREYYRMGFLDGQRSVISEGPRILPRFRSEIAEERISEREEIVYRKPKRKLSAWNKFVKANSRKKEFRYRDGKLNLKKMGVAFRRKKRR